MEIWNFVGLEKDKDKRGNIYVCEEKAWLKLKGKLNLNTYF